MRKLSVFVAILTLWGIAVEAGVAVTWTFDDDAPGKTPKGFTAAVGEWKVATDGDGKVLEQSAKNADPVFNIALLDEPNVKDVDLSIKIKAVAGTLDQGGGIVWCAPRTRRIITSPVTTTWKTTSASTKSSPAFARNLSKTPTSNITTVGRPSARR